MSGTVMLESGLAEITVCQVEGVNAMVQDEGGDGFWVALSDIEWEG